MKQLQRLNTISGWIVFSITTGLYLLTLEPTASSSVNGEIIAAAVKLQIGDSPGAPLLLLFGRIVSLIAGQNTVLIPILINSFSALISSFTILFLFWSITNLSLKIFGEKATHSLGNKLIIIGSAMVGSLCLAVSNSFWSNAVEAGFYSFSTLLTAIIFWAILKWENIADNYYSNRWLLLIAYLIGLSIGISLSSLLVIPAVSFVYYYKKYSFSIKGFLLTFIISCSILLGIAFILIPGLVKTSMLFERIFTNGVGLPFWSGSIIFLILVVGTFAAGIILTHRRAKPILNTLFLALALIFLGYSSYATIIIRSNANPPIDRGNPENAFTVLPYITKTQNNDSPLFIGRTFNSPRKILSNSKKEFAPVRNKYKIVSYKEQVKYDSDYKTFLPRMWSSEQKHIKAYLDWTNQNLEEYYLPQLTSENEPLLDAGGNVLLDLSQPKKKPGLLANIEFFLRYQLNHMYFRYFMWNFSGRQNDLQSHLKEDIHKGNWISGLNLIDGRRIGNQRKMPQNFIHNQARNKYYMLPFILGIIGLLFLIKRKIKHFGSVFALFFFTGIGLVYYFNHSPFQHAELDHLYLGSYYAFSIWIGLSVLALHEYGKSEVPGNSRKMYIWTVAFLVIVLLLDFLINKGVVIFPTALFAIAILYTFLGVIRFIHKKTKSALSYSIGAISLAFLAPVLMVFQNWDDHYHSGKHLAHEMAVNLLNSCEQNAVLFTQGRTSTYPLLYVQEVEGMRTDIRIIDLDLFRESWYIDQTQNQRYKSTPVPFSLKKEQYRYNNRGVVHLIERVNRSISLQEALDFIAHDENEYKSIPGTKGLIEYIPQHRFTLRANSNKVIANNTITPYTKGKFIPKLEFTIEADRIYKNQLMMLDLITTNDWERPIYFTTTIPEENFLGLQDFFESAGLNYRLLPANMKDGYSRYGGINTELMYKRLINDFQYGDIGNPDLYYDESILYMLEELRLKFSITATKLMAEKKQRKALKLIERSLELIPNEILPMGINALQMAQTYHNAGKKNESLLLIDQVHQNTLSELDYYTSLSKRYKAYFIKESGAALDVMKKIQKLLNQMGEKELSKKYAEELKKFTNLVPNNKK